MSSRGGCMSETTTLPLRPAAIWIAIVGMTTLASCGGGTRGASTPPVGVSTPSRHSSAAHDHSPTPSESAIPHEAPVPAESNPPGDIPDNTAFVPYRSSAGGFRLPVPEGWARSTTKHSVVFTDKLNTIEVAWEPSSRPPSVAATNKDVVPQLKTTQRAFRLEGVKAASLPAGPAVV